MRLSFMLARILAAWITYRSYAFNHAHSRFKCAMVLSIPEITASRSSTTFGSYSILCMFEWFKLALSCLHDSHFTAAMIPQTSILSFVHYFIRKTGIKSLPNTRINVQCEKSDEHIIGTHWLTAYYGVRGRIALEKKNGQQEAYAEK